MMIVNAWIGLANSRAVEYGTPEKIHLNALFWIGSALNLRLYWKSIMENRTGVIQC
jgi:hypothetical protein